jgi:urease accessory protein UreF
MALMSKICRWNQMTRAEQVERDERRRARRAWQAVQRQARARADWLPPVSNPEWRAQDNSPRDGRDWAAAGAVVSFHPDKRTFNSAGVLGVWS